MVYATNSAEQLELFTEADMESVQIESMDLEGLESLLEENLESVSVEDVAEDVEEYMEYMEEESVGYGATSSVTRRLSKIFTSLIKKAVKKITMNPVTRGKLHAACRKGPNGVTKLITPIVAKPLPSYLRFLAPIYCRPIVRRLFPSICKEAGLTAKSQQRKKL